MPTREELVSKIQAELARRKDPNRITTEEQARSRAESVDEGGLEAGPWYMDIAKDVLNPVDSLAGLLTGGARAAGQGVRSLGKKALEKTLGGAAEQQAVIDLVNKGSGLAPRAASLIEDAAKGISERGIAPKEAKLRGLLQGTSGEINPDVVANVFPNYAKKLAEKRGTVQVPVPISLDRELQQNIPLEGLGTKMVEKNVPQGRVPVSGEQLLRIKRGADKAAGFSKAQAPFSETAASKNANARLVGDLARDQIYESAPGSEEVLSQMGRDIKLKDFLRKKGASNPVGLLKSTPGTTKDSLLAAADEVAGSSLRPYGNKIERAVELQMNPSNLVRPLKALSETYKIGTRGAIKAGSVAHGGLQTAGNVLGKSVAPEALGYGGAIEGLESLKPLQPSNNVPLEESAPRDDRNEIIQRIKAELLRRQAP